MAEAMARLRYLVLFSDGNRWLQRLKFIDDVA